MRAVFTLAICAALLGCTKTTTSALRLPPLRTVPQVDLERYLGRWYEIASYPQRFQRWCTGTTATYSLREDGRINVVNRCNEHSLSGEERVVEGVARVAERDTNAKLEVSFFGPFWADYWIIVLDEDYEYAAVGHPSRDSLWILSRRPTMSPVRYQAILAEVEALGYDRRRLRKTVQSD